MVEPKISVIVPSYNVAEYLPRVVDSLRKQTADKGLWEAVFVNDCSTDNSLDVLYELGCDSDNMRVVCRGENGGLSAARNSGIENSSGKYIAQLDGDDMLEPFAVEKVVQYLGSNPRVQYFYSSLRMVDENGNLIKDKVCRPFDPNALLHYNFVSALKGYTREVNDQIGGFRNGYAEDWDHVLRAAGILDSCEIGRIPEFLYFYTMRQGSIVHATSEAKKRQDVCDFLKPHVEARVGEPVRMFWSHKQNFDDGNSFNYYDWEVLKNGKTSGNTE